MSSVGGASGIDPIRPVQPQMGVNPVEGRHVDDNAIPKLNPENIPKKFNMTGAIKEYAPKVFSAIGSGLLYGLKYAGIGVAILGKALAIAILKISSALLSVVTLTAAAVFYTVAFTTAFVVGLALGAVLGLAYTPLVLIRGGDLERTIEEVFENSIGRSIVEVAGLVTGGLFSAMGGGFLYLTRGLLNVAFDVNTQYELFGERIRDPSFESDIIDTLDVAKWAGLIGAGTTGVTTNIVGLFTSGATVLVGGIATFPIWGTFLGGMALHEKIKNTM